MSKAKSILAIIGAILVTVFLVLAWDMLGNYYAVLRFMPDVTLFGARVACGIVIVYLLYTGISGLVSKGSATQEEK